MQLIEKSDFFSHQGWYPARAPACRAEIESYTADAAVSESEAKVLTGGIVPHAGWVYSGRLACQVFQTLALGGPVTTVVLFGSHMGPDSKPWILGTGIWKTPLGELEGDDALAGKLAESVAAIKPDLLEPDEYRPDNTIELQMPFIKHFLPDARFVVVGAPASADSIKMGKRAGELAAESADRILVVGSTDLTHYGSNYGFMPVGGGIEAVDWVKNENDKKAVDAVARMDPEGLLKEGLKRHNACCPGAAAAALSAAKARGATTGRVLSYRTSYDVRPSSSFVGYVSAVF